MPNSSAASSEGALFYLRLSALEFPVHHVIQIHRNVDHAWSLVEKQNACSNDVVNTIKVEL